MIAISVPIPVDGTLTTHLVVIKLRYRIKIRYRTCMMTKCCSRILTHVTFKKNMHINLKGVKLGIPLILLPANCTPWYERTVRKSIKIRTKDQFILGSVLTLTPCSGSVHIYCRTWLFLTYISTSHYF